MMPLLVIYIVFSLVVGLVLTLLCWEEDKKAKRFETVLTFLGMVASFALIWPAMALVILFG